MPAFYPRQIVDQLIGVLNRNLRGVIVRTDIDSKIVQRDVRERIETGPAEIAGGDGLIQPVVAEPQFVRHRRRKIVVLGQGGHMIGIVIERIKSRKISGHVDLRQTVVNVAAAQLIAVGPVVIHRGYQVLIVLVIR